MASEITNAPHGRGSLWRNVGLAAAFVVPFAVYLFTLAPSLNFEDPAEFALGCATLGVDHPSGYPLETLAGHLFTYLPVGEVAWRVNLSSAAFGAAASAFVFLLAWELLTPVVKSRRLLAASSWAAGGLFAFSSTFWPQAIMTEVYALNAALLAAALWCGARCYGRGDARWFYAAAFAAALSAANHPLSLVATVPLLAFLWWRLRRSGKGLELLLTGGALILLGLSVYLYLALRASRNPPLNWGTPANLPSFLDHIRRREFGAIYWPRYRYLGFHAVELGKLLLLQFGPGPGALAPLGLAWLLARKTPLAGTTAVVAALTGPLMLLPLVGLLLPHQVVEIELWYIPFFILCALFAAAFFAAAAGKIKRKSVAAFAAAAVALLPLYPLLYHLPRVDLRDYRFAAEHGRNVLRTYPYRAVAAFPFHGRQGLLVSSFYRFTEWRRADAIVLDPSNVVRGDEASVRRAPRAAEDADAAERWWLGYCGELLAQKRDRPFFYPLPLPPQVWGVQFETFGTLYRGRRPDERGEWQRQPWGRYEYRGFRSLGAHLSRKRSPNPPTAYRNWANYWSMAAAYCFARGRAGPALRNLAAAKRAVAKDPVIGLKVATLYEVNGYPNEAIPVYLSYLPVLERYRYDTPTYRREYAVLLNGLGRSHLSVGDVESARRYFSESVAADPEQAEIAALLAGDGLAAAAAALSDGERPKTASPE